MIHQELAEGLFGIQKDELFAFDPCAGVGAH
jgi:hypothetical protein